MRALCWGHSLHLRSDHQHPRFRQKFEQGLPIDPSPHGPKQVCLHGTWSRACLWETSRSLSIWKSIITPWKFNKEVFVQSYSILLIVMLDFQYQCKNFEPLPKLTVMLKYFVVSTMCFESATDPVKKLSTDPAPLAWRCEPHNYSFFLRET